MVIESQAMAAKRAQEGYTYQHERSFDVAEKVAQNESIGNFTNTGIGLGMMGGVAGGMGAVVAGITTDALGSIAPGAGQNNMANPVAGFGVVVPPVIDLKGEAPKTAPQEASAPDSMAAFKEKLEKLKMMKEMGMLSDGEFEAEKKKLLSGL